MCFTANATAAIKLVAESFPFQSGGTLVLSADNHNSMNGIREFARRGGVRAHYAGLDDELRLCDATQLLERVVGKAPGLFGYPAQSNFSGVRHPLSLIGEAQRLGYEVLLDAAAILPSSRLSLREVSPEYVVLSFYKIFGYPTGVGALVARRDALARLRRPWFAGGTVEYASVQNDTHRLRPRADGFEDGTPDFLSIAAVHAGCDWLHAVGVERISVHVAGLTGELIYGLRSLRRRDGRPVVRIFGPTGGEARGGTVAFNVLPPSGQSAPHAEIEDRARHAGVASRGGRFCNPGASEAAFGFRADVTGDCLRRSAATGFTLAQFSACMGSDVPVGAVRASVGPATNRDDVRRAVAVAAGYSG